MGGVEEGGTEICPRNTSFSNWWKHQMVAIYCSGFLPPRGGRAHRCQRDGQGLGWERLGLPSLTLTLSYLCCRAKLSSLQKVAQAQHVGGSWTCRCCSARTCSSWPTASGPRVPLSPFSPKIMMNTLAWVPAPGVHKTEAMASLNHSPLALASLLGSREEPGVPWASSESSKPGMRSERAGQCPGAPRCTTPILCLMFWALLMLLG